MSDNNNQQPINLPQEPEQAPGAQPDNQAPPSPASSAGSLESLEIPVPEGEDDLEPHPDVPADDDGYDADIEDEGEPEVQAPPHLDDNASAVSEDDRN